MPKRSILIGLLALTSGLIAGKLVATSTTPLLPAVGNQITIQLRRDALGVVGSHLKSDVVDGTRVSLSGRLAFRDNAWWVVESGAGNEKSDLWIPTHSILFAKVSASTPTGKIPAAQERLSLNVESFSEELQLEWNEEINVLGDGNPKFVSAAIFQPLNTQVKFLISRPTSLRTSRGGFVVDYVLRPIELTSSSSNVQVSIGFSSAGTLVSVQVVPPDNNTGICASTADAAHWGEILGTINRRVREGGHADDGLAPAVYRSAYAVHRALRVEGSDPAGYQAMTSVTPLARSAPE